MITALEQLELFVNSINEYHEYTAFKELDLRVYFGDVRGLADVPVGGWEGLIIGMEIDKRAEKYGVFALLLKTTLPTIVSKEGYYIWLYKGKSRITFYNSHSVEEIVEKKETFKFLILRAYLGDNYYTNIVFYTDKMPKTIDKLVTMNIPIYEMIPPRNRMSIFPLKQL
jgi:hypothetical protein